MLRQKKTFFLILGCCLLPKNIALPTRGGTVTLALPPGLYANVNILAQGLTKPKHRNIINSQKSFSWEVAAVGTLH